MITKFVMYGSYCIALSLLIVFIIEIFCTIEFHWQVEDRKWNQSCSDPALNICITLTFRDENRRKKVKLDMMMHKWISCLARLQPAFKLAHIPYNKIFLRLPACQHRSSLGENQEMRIQKSAFRVISTNELAFTAMENARLWLQFVFCCSMNIFI